MKKIRRFRYPPAPFSSQYTTAVKHRGAVKIMNSFLEIWKSVQDYCKTQITEVAFNVSIAPLTLVRLDDSTALLTIERTFKKEIVAVKFNDLLCEAFEQVLGFPVRVEIIVADEGEKNRNRNQHKVKNMNIPLKPLLSALLINLPMRLPKRLQQIQAAHIIHFLSMEIPGWAKHIFSMQSAMKSAFQTPIQIFSMYGAKILQTS